MNGEYKDVLFILNLTNNSSIGTYYVPYLSSGSITNPTSITTFNIGKLIH